MSDETPTTPQTSVEKIHNLLPRVRELQPRTQAEEALLSFAPMLLPHLGSILPTDAAELDDMLREASAFVATLVSDEGTVTA